MVSEPQSWGGQTLPKAPVFVRPRRRVTLLMLTRSPQLLALTGLCLGVAALAWLGAGYLDKSHLVSEKESSLARAESANAALQDELANLQDELDTTNSSLTAAQERIAALTAEAEERLQRQHAELQQQLSASQAAASTMSGHITKLQHELHQAGAQKSALVARLSRMEAELRSALKRQAELRANLAQTAKRLQQMTADRGRIASDRDYLGKRVIEAKKQSAAEPAKAGKAQAANRPAAPAPRARRRSRSSEIEGGKLAELERVLASAGVDVRRVFAQFAPRPGKGGPFIPAPGRDAPASPLSAEQLALLRHLFKSLPLTAPLTHYVVESPFGIRRDPFNGRRSFHTGIDLAAPYMSPVYATAAGTVTFAGYRGEYGKMVEIDHGHGIATRYAHLHRYMVSVGQNVRAHAEIGLLGSTGRATGPHVHYEVLVNGEPQNPAKFIGLAHLVPVSHEHHRH
jgi:murein DD-endopeptidase MepM/ murein hydrolase activator NlpD